MHHSGFSAGVLRPGRIWLGDDGSACLPGNGFAHLEPTRSRLTLPEPGDDPPGERSPSIPGDAYRLGFMIHVLLAGSPFRGLDTMGFLQGAWPTRSPETSARLGAAAPLVDQLLTFDSPRPSGDALWSLLTSAGPTDAAAVVARLVQSPW